jgi:hypothetical protein
MAKPGDFLIGVIDFLGILLPGAVLVFLHGSFLREVFNVQLTIYDQTGIWILFFVCSYILGHFLLGAGVPLNKFQGAYLAESTDEYYQEVRDQISLPYDVKQNREDSFYRAYSFVRLYNAAAIAEVDRQAAEYKLFRSLTIVFLLDLLLAWLRGMHSWPRALLAFALAGLALWRFLFLLNWARRLTFEYYFLMTKGPRPVASA